MQLAQLLEDERQRIEELRKLVQLEQKKVRKERCHSCSSPHARIVWQVVKIRSAKLTLENNMDRLWEKSKRMIEAADQEISAHREAAEAGQAASSARRW